MTGASIETTLELWASSLRDVKARMRALFTQERVAASANLFLDGLLGDERRKTGWMRAEAAGDPGPRRQQASPPSRRPRPAETRPLSWHFRPTQRNSSTHTSNCNGVADLSWHQECCAGRPSRS